MHVFFWSRRSGPEGHPDPDGFHLAIVCRIVREFLKFLRGRFSPSSDVGLFWDFGSLYQNPRDPDQDDLFKKGLAASNIWYASTACGRRVNSCDPTAWLVTITKQRCSCYLLFCGHVRAMCVLLPASRVTARQPAEESNVGQFSACPSM